MCISRGAPVKPAYGACNETHAARWRQVRVPVIQDLTARVMTTDDCYDMVTIETKTEWRYC